MIGFLPPKMATFSHSVTSRNVKVWYGDEAHEHYEVQHASGKIEIGFHAEHADAARNDAVLAGLLGEERAWRRALGPDARAGRYLGRRAPAWRRVSEVWDGAPLDDPEVAVEAADRLAAYIGALEPVRRGATRRGGRRARR